MAHAFVRGTVVSLLVGATIAGCTNDISGRAESVSNPDAAIESLFGERAGAVIEASPRVVRAREVDLRLRELGLAGDLREVGTERLTHLRLPLFEDREVTAELTELTVRSERELLWTGRAVGVDESDVVLSVVDGVVSGLVRLGTEAYELAPYSGGRYLVTQVRLEALPDEMCLSTPKMAGTAAPLPATDVVRGKIVDVLVAYTPEARARAFGTASMQGAIASVVAYTNLAFERSAVATRLQLVGTMEVAYTETQNPWTDLSALTGTDDGKMDAVHKRRDELGADLVVLVTQGLGSFCGVGWVMGSEGSTVDQSFAPWAFSVVDRGCFSNHTFAHELGHNMGSMHDRDNSTLSGAYPYSHGARYSNRFRTIMSYPCEGDTCPRIPYFSNPSISYEGFPTGAMLADNARSLNQTAPVVAGFRPTGGINVPPRASFTTSTRSGTAPLVVKLDGSSSTDPDGTIVSYLWKFGDGTRSRAVAPSHTFDTPGSYNVVLTVTDDRGASASKPRTINVTPATTVGSPPPPVCSDDRALCAGVCVRLSSNESHCGVCGNKCVTGATCNAGRCE